MRRRPFLKAIAAAALPLASPSLRAQAWPAQPVKLMIAFPAGGPTDITMRVLADNASKLLGQQVLIDNKPGAGGTLPAQQLQQSRPDGYTLAQIPLGVFRLPYSTKITWDPLKDITYIIGITGYAFGIVVPSDSPIKTWADFVAYAKANPGKLSYGSTGVLTSPHLTMEDIAQRTGITLNHVPYKGSADLMIGGPKGMDSALVQRIHDAFKQAMEMPNHVEALAKYDQLLMHMSPQQYTKFAEDTFKREKALVEKLGLAKPS